MKMLTLTVVTVLAVANLLVTRRVLQSPEPSGGRFGPILMIWALPLIGLFLVQAMLGGSGVPGSSAAIDSDDNDWSGTVTSSSYPDSTTEDGKQEETCSSDDNTGWDSSNDDDYSCDASDSSSSD